MRYPAVLSESLTIQRALMGDNLARFGDGELKIATGRSAKSQRHHPLLEAALRRILRARRRGVLACIPNVAAQRSPKETFWSQYRTPRYTALMDGGAIYGSSFISRPDSADAPFTDDYWRLVARLWEGREIVILRGEGSGKGLLEADLEGAAGVEVIEGPREQAWAMHDELLARLKGEDRRVLMCLGATATVLAWELREFGVHAIDLGHLALFLRKSKTGEAPAVTHGDSLAP